MENIYKVVIIEDSEEDTMLLANSLKSYDFLYIVGNLTSGFAAPALILKEKPDLLFIDVELPGIKGYDILSKLNNLITWNMEVVFYTAHPQYMIDAIRVSAFDYLLKPFDKNELDLIVNRFVQVKSEANSNSITSIQQDARPDNDKTTFTIQLPNGDIQILRLSSIGYFKFNTLRRCWEVFLYNQKSQQLRSTINATQLLSFTNQFMQIHKSYIINIQYLAMIHGDICIMFPPFNKNELPISGKYKKELQNNFIQF